MVTPSLATLTQIFFNQLLISMNLHHGCIQHAKDQAFSSFCSRDLVNLKILQSDWPRAFWAIPHKPDFSKVWDLCKNTANNIKLLYRPNSENIND